MKGALFGLGGATAPIAAAVAIVAVIGGALSFFDWHHQPRRGDTAALTVPAMPALPGTARAARRALRDRASRAAAAAATTARPPRRRPGAAVSPAGTGVVPRPATPVSGQSLPPTTSPAPRPPQTGGEQTTPAEPAPPAGTATTPATEAGAGATTRSPLAGIGTILAVAAENGTAAVGSLLSGTTRAIGIGSLGHAVDGTLTGLGLALGGAVRRVTGAPPRAAAVAQRP